MKHSLLTYMCCSTCGSDLTLAIPSPGEAQNDDSVEIRDGLLVCHSCHRWFPIRNLIPEMLPDHLRDWEKDLAFLKTIEQKLPAALFKELLEKSQDVSKQAKTIEDHGSNYKKSEISLETKVTDEHFFGPGYFSPFNPGAPEFTMHLIRRLANVLPLLEIKQGDVVLDMGAGYAWTTEWLMKMGMVAIGVDICRTYLDIGVQRMGKNLPHLIIGDIENLPIKTGRLNAVLCYDAFHHIPDRKKAMSHFTRALGDRGNIVLAEPGGTHEFAKVSTDVMDKYGILEKGMEKDDIINYCEGLNVLPPEQHYVVKIQDNELEKTLSPEFVYTHAHVNCNIFVVKKQKDARGLTLQGISLKRRIKTKIKRVLVWFFYKLVG